MEVSSLEDVKIGIIGTNGRTGRILIKKFTEGDFKNITGFTRSITDSHLDNGIIYKPINFNTNEVNELVDKFNGLDVIVFLASACQSDIHQLFVVDIDGFFKCIEACKILNERNKNNMTKLKDNNEDPVGIVYHKAPHIVFISVIDIEERKNWWSLEGLIKNYIIAKRCCEHELKASNLNWTVLKTGWLTQNNNSTGKIKNVEEINSFYRQKKLSNELTLERDDLADVIICCFKYLKQLNHKYVPILAGDHLIEDVLSNI